ncbi:MAG: sigma-54 interaction domain-containing protein [Tissierella sp.]|uniref:sigma-54 interaction domain-containing protein n=1 Tax=Tissierella sp. TaxID=41274 RepID=UPI003F965234
MSDYNEKNKRLYFLERVLENLYDGVLISDSDGKVVVYNKAMEELEKRNAKDMIGKYIWDAYGYNDEAKSEHMKVFKSGIPIVNKYKAHAFNDGHPIYKSYSTYPVIYKGKTIGVYSISKNEYKLQSLLSEIIELKKESIDKVSKESIGKNGTRFTFSDIIGESLLMKNVIDEAKTISWLDNNVLIIGETGTGKEMFAQSIHNYSKRKESPFIGINCSAIPENLLESILFGTVKGAFTGATDSQGLFLEAGEGTIFLDELNSMPINMQTKLLRVLQERQVRKVGGKDTVPIKCRVISAMNEEPHKLIKDKKLREDLYYRIGGYNLNIPPLRKRAADIYFLSEHYIKRNNLLMGKEVLGLSDRLKNIIKRHKWMGNVRELEHFIENTMVRSKDEEYLKYEHIPEYILENMQRQREEDSLDMELREPLDERLEKIEREYILETLNKNHWNVAKSARKLNITRQSLIYRMKKLDIIKEN